MPGMSDDFDLTTTSQAVGILPELASLHERWTMRRKATLVFAVRNARISIEEASRTCKLSTDEFLGWQRSLNRYGIAGLYTTRCQIYRDGERRAARALSGLASSILPTLSDDGDLSEREPLCHSRLIDVPITAAHLRWCSCPCVLPRSWTGQRNGPGPGGTFRLGQG